MQTKPTLLLGVLAVFMLIGCDKAVYIRPPFQGVTNVQHSISFDAQLGDTLKIGNGTQIQIPPNAFQDAEGNDISGQVQFNYTEMDNPKSILISGIPLNFGNSDQMEIMESAVMFDINANQNGVPLQLKEGKQINTIISSNVTSNEYDLFQLNQEESSWTNLSNVEPYENPAIAVLNANLDASDSLLGELNLENCFAMNYIKDLDIIFKKDQYKLRDKRFNYFAPGEAPAYRTLKNLIRAKLSNYNIPMTNLSDFSAVRYKGKKYSTTMLVWQLEKAIPQYILNGREQTMESGYNYSKPWMTLEVNPMSKRKYRFVFYKNEWINRKVKKTKIFTTKGTIKTSLEELYTSPPEQLSAAYDSLFNKIEIEKQQLEAQNKVLRQFQISQLGVYNYDKIKNDDRIYVKASITVDGKEVNGPSDLFVIPKGENTVLRYDEKYMDKFVIYPNQGMIAFLVNEGNVIALSDQQLTHQQYLKYKDSGEQAMTITLKTSDFVIQNEQDVGAFLDHYLSSDESVVSMRHKVAN